MATKIILSIPIWAVGAGRAGSRVGWERRRDGSGGGAGSRVGAAAGLGTRRKLAALPKREVGLRRVLGRPGGAREAELGAFVAFQAVAAGVQAWKLRRKGAATARHQLGNY